MASKGANKIYTAFGSRRLYHKIGIVGVPFNKGQPKEGVELGPVSLRGSGLIEDLRSLHPQMDVEDYGDVKYELTNKNLDPKVKNLCDVAACNNKLSDHVLKVLRDGRICLTIGGDHCIGMGSIDGHARACEPGKLAVLWVDAHADINTYNSSPTGNFHGMAVSRLVKELTDEWPELPVLKWQKPLLSLKDVAYIGLRSVDIYEKFIIDSYGVTAFGMKEVEHYGVHNVIKMALERIDPDSDRFIHVSFDIDSLDVLEAPSTGTPGFMRCDNYVEFENKRCLFLVRGGLTLREGIEIMEMVCNTGRLQAMDLVEINPRVGTLKDVQVTLEAAKQIVLAAFGHKRKGRKL